MVEPPERRTNQDGSMLTFMTMAMLVYGSMHLYAFGKVWMAFPHSSGLALALTLAGIALTFSPYLVWHMERQGWHGATAAAWASYVWMGFLFLFFCAGVVFDAGHALAELLRVRWPLSGPMALGATALVALAALGYGAVEAQRLRIEEIRIATPKLAAGRVTIAQISDLHLGRLAGDALVERVVAAISAIRPDIVVATGDLLDAQGDDLDALAGRFRSYAPPLGAYAVLGNHEHYSGLEHALRFLRNAGFTVLRGETAAAGGIVVAGADDPGAYGPDRPAGRDARASPASIAASDFIVLLRHQPVVDSHRRFDLQLSGHVHGGQVFPFGYVTRLAYGVRAGLTRLDDGRLLYVSRGAGTWGPPIRLLAPPEITLITIESERKAR